MLRGYLSLKNEGDLSQGHAPCSIFFRKVGLHFSKTCKILTVALVVERYPAEDLAQRRLLALQKI